MRSKKYNYIYVLAIFITIFILLEAIVIFQVNRSKEQEFLLETEKLAEFKHEINDAFSKYIYLSQGFTINIEHDLNNPTLMKNDLERIFILSDDFINNIGIIKDTTLVYNYPIEGNQSSIGIDLTTIESQKDLILYVRNFGEIIIQGPINLVQGGNGFVLRLPIYDNNMYWGQVGVVFKEKEFEQYMVKIAEEYDFEIQIVNNINKEIFVNTITSNDTEKISTLYEDYNLDWSINAIPLRGWTSFNILILLGSIISFLLSGIIAYFYIKLLDALDKLTYQVNHDELTGLYNRRFLDEKMTSVLAEYTFKQEKFGILSMDVNDFKFINDTYGHKTGDFVLINIARNLEYICFKGCQIFRIGGDEIVVVVYDIDSFKTLQSLKEDIIEYFNSTVIVESINLSISLSIGTALFPMSGVRLDTLLTHADLEMYNEKKKHKRNSLVK